MSLETEEKNKLIVKIEKQILTPRKINYKMLHKSIINKYLFI